MVISVVTAFLIPLMALGAVALMIGILARRESRANVSEVVRGTRVLVCSLNEAAHADLEADAKVYSSLYKHVEVSSPSRWRDLLATVSAGSYDVVHLFSDIGESGRLLDGEGTRVDGGDLLMACRKGDVKLLIVARDNPADNYMKAFHKSKEPSGLRLNLVITIARRGQRFPRFLEGLLKQVSNAKSLPQAWAELAPQTHSGAHGHLPETMFFAGRGGVELLP